MRTAAAARYCRLAPRYRVTCASARSDVAVHGESLTLHLASPQTPASASTPLVLYATGDGGWFGAAVGMFHTIASNGYPTVGFSSKELMRIEHKRSRPLDVAQLAEGYQQIIDAACAQLRLPSKTPVVLTGWSRGAAFAVLVAGEFEADSRVVGLVAIGLAAEEHLDIEGDTDDDVDAPGPSSPAPRPPVRLRSIRSYRSSSRVASSSFRPRETATCVRRAHASCSAPTRRRAAWWRSTRAITASAAASRALPPR